MKQCFSHVDLSHGVSTAGGNQENCDNIVYRSWRVLISQKISDKQFMSCAVAIFLLSILFVTLITMKINEV